MTGPVLHGTAAATESAIAERAAANHTARRRGDVRAIIVVIGVALVLWLPRSAGPIDLRWDGGVYYILGTSLAEGRGYKLLNEPGDIDAVQYPPLLSAVVAVHQLLLGTSDWTIVGRSLRLTSFLVFIAYAIVVLRFLRTWLRVRFAVLGTLLSLFCMHAWFLSDTLFPEVWFSVATLLFLISAEREDSRAHSVLAYFWAVVAYGLRTVGLAGLAVWVLHSVIRRRFRQAALRALLALIPVVSWQVYVASVERSPGYTSPAYEYQRAPYLFHNVTYASNIALRDPFTPEKGDVMIHRRIARNAVDIPLHFGETLSGSRRYFDMWIHRLLGDGVVTARILFWAVFALLSVFGGVLVFGGVGVQLVKGHTLVPLYIILYSTALCLTPFPEQSLRYLMPIQPLLALSAIVFLLHLGTRRHGLDDDRPRTKLPFLVLGPALLIQGMVTTAVYALDYQPFEHVDQAGKVVGNRMFFYDEAQREFDDAVDYLRTHAQAGDVIAAGTPHWIHLRTGLRTVMPPFETDVTTAQRLLDTVPVRYLVIGEDVVVTERYTVPVVRQFADRWTAAHSTPAGHWTVYRRIK